MYKILIVEDDVKLGNELKKFLSNSLYNCTLLTDFNNTIEYILNNTFDLILLDINIPNINGEIVLKEIRKKIDTPVIIVTSRNNEVDELLSINYGADDFITKPYNTEILLARIERLLKRTSITSNIINYEDLKLDISKSIIIKGETIIDLSRNELKIFNYLLINRGKIVSRDELMDYLWGINEFIDDNTLTVNINRLRSKLESIKYPDIIKTKRGLGYIIL